MDALHERCVNDPSRIEKLINSRISCVCVDLISYEIANQHRFKDFPVVKECVRLLHSAKNILDVKGYFILAKALHSIENKSFEPVRNMIEDIYLSQEHRLTKYNVLYLESIFKDYAG